MGFKLTKEEYEGIKKLQERTGQDIKKILVKALKHVLLSDSEPFSVKRINKKKNIADLPRRFIYPKSRNKIKGPPTINH